MYQPPPQKSVGTRPCSRSHSPSSRTRAAGSPPVGRACVGLVQCVWWPSGPRAAASRARSSQSPRSSPSCGGRISAAISKRCCSARKRRHASSSSGRSRWQDTIAGKLGSMCGICGLYSPAGDAPPAALVDAMRVRIRHRGPDQGSTTTLGPCVLGNQRLCVLDLEHGEQPVANETGDVVAVFNGELYNFRDLRRELGTHDVRGTGDTPVIPHLYEEHGVDFVERLEGMFAIALFDAARDRLVLARDRLGKKPLVWTRLDDGTLAFASELKALLAVPGVRAEPDLAALDAYLALGYVPGDRTGLVGISRLLPGYVLVADGEEERSRRYWQPRVSGSQPLGEEEWLARVRLAGGEAGAQRRDAAVRPAAMRLAARVPHPVAGAGAKLLRGAGERRSLRFRAARFLDVAAAPEAARYGRIMEVFSPAERVRLWTDDALAELAPLRSAAALLG